MIKLSKKITKTIEREFPEQNVTIIKRVYIHSVYKDLCVNFINLRVEQSKTTIILRYFGDNSYSFLGGFTNFKEVADEIANQVKKLF